MDYHSVGERTRLLSENLYNGQNDVEVKNPRHTQRYSNSGSTSLPDYDSIGHASHLRRRRRERLSGSCEADDEMDDRKLLSTKYESLDYDEIENSLFKNEEQHVATRRWSSFIVQLQISRWIVFLLIGMFTACIAALVDVSIDYLSKFKYSHISTYFEKDMDNQNILKPFAIWVAIDVIFVTFAAFLVAYVEPVAAGSGIPQIKCYLNGVKIPHVVRFKTLVTKITGVIFAVAGGLAVGKEGPMIHAGAVVAAGVSQGRSTTFKKDCGVFRSFRSDHEKRDFVSGGAAAGVAAAFGAPVGGVLFSLEEGASFWNQALTWRIFFASMTCTFTLNVLLSFYHNNPLSLSSPGLINFGDITGQYYGYELLIFMLMGVIGGLLGAVFNAINYRLSILRTNYLYKKWMCVAEAALISSMTVAVSFVCVYVNNDCQPEGKDDKNPLQLFCGDGEHTASGTLFFNKPEDAVRSLFHANPGTFSPWTLLPFAIIYFFLACITYGLSVPSGLFIPCLLAGAAWGRLIGIGLSMMSSVPWSFSDPGKYALIGAAAQLGGVIRMTISLTVILMEATGNITWGLPLMLVLMIAKWTGDLFNHGLYDIHIQLQNVPFLHWAPPPLSSSILAEKILSAPVITMNTIEKVGNIVDLLKEPSSNHNGFPVVDPYDMTNSTTGTLRGLILRDQLIVLLKEKAFSVMPSIDEARNMLHIEDFRDAYPRFPDIKDIHISDLERDCSIDLRPFMNPSPYTVPKEASLPRIFRLFRALGLRHLMVTDENYRVIGIVTRKDLARYRFWTHRGMAGVDKLHITN